MPTAWMPLTKGLEIALSPAHRFTTDSVLLSDFAAPRATDRVVELCAGCGAVSLLWFTEGSIPPKSVIGWEISPEAAALFRQSVEKNRLAAAISVREGDLREKENFPAGSADLVVCNPPYFPPAQGGGSRQMARQEVTASLSQVTGAAARLLRYGGRFAVCFPAGRLPDLFEALRANRLEPKKIRLVTTKPEQPPYLVLVEARAGGGKQLDWLPPLLLFDASGAATKEYQRIYGETDPGSLPKQQAVSQKTNEVKHG